MAGLPALLFHYCPPASFLGILRDKAIWLSSVSHLNDYAELKWIEGIIQRTLKELDYENHKEKFDKLLTLYRINSPMPFVACFSEVGDLLSQWRAYTDDGEGVTVGFNPHTLDIQPNLPWTSSVAQHTIGFGQVLYEPSLQEQLVGQVLREHLQGNCDDTATISRGMALRQLSWVLKNPAFAEEREWRIIFTPLVTEGPKGAIDVFPPGVPELKHRTVRGHLVAYFERCFPLHSIERIVLGPKCKFETFELKTLLAVHGYSSVEVERSSATYR